VCGRASRRNVGKVLFVNAVAEVTRERRRASWKTTTLQDRAACSDFAEAPGFAHVATLDEVRSHGANLSIRCTSAGGRGAGRSSRVHGGSLREIVASAGQFGRVAGGDG